MNYKLRQGDNLELLKKLPDNSIDSVVTDGPYGLSFMNRKWDYDVPSVELWKEVLRVLKPGGHLLSFGGTRTYHRMVVNIEDAGFEIRDQIMWLYGSGFPKSHNIGKAVDKIEGNEREVVGEKNGGAYSSGTNNVGIGQIIKDGRKTLPTRGDDFGKITKGSSPYEGWGTALKPANEPICVARKPLSEKSVALNVLKWGTGGINVDGCRVGSDLIQSSLVKPEKNTHHNYTGTDESNALYDDEGNRLKGDLNEGRFPANIILECICDEVIKGEKGECRYGRKGGTNESDFSKAISPNPDYETIHYNDKGDIHINPMCPCRLLDEQSGVSKTNCKKGEVVGELLDEQSGMGASRFFYQAKVSKKERNLGLDGFEEKQLHSINQLDDRQRLNGTIRETPVHKNNHPTVKPVQLMAYLCRLVTPPGGTILDMYMGSGSTGIAALLEGFNFIGMDLDKDYVKIAEARIENYEKYREFLKK